MNKSELVAQPLGLANLYLKGEGVIWATLAEASDTLSRTEPKVSRAQLKNAKDILSLPHEILSLFEESGINSFTIRKLVLARSTFGIEELLKRAASLAPARDEEDRRKILRVLNGETKMDVGLVSVAALVAEYEAGKALHRWENVYQASKQLGLNNQLYRAIDVMKLPKTILDLFSVESITLSVGRKLEKLVSLHGPDEVLRRATWAKSGEKELTNAQKLSILRKGELIGVKAIRYRDKVVVEFHCPDRDGHLNANLDLLLNVLNVAIKSISIKRNK